MRHKTLLKAQLLKAKPFKIPIKECVIGKDKVDYMLRYASLAAKIHIHQFA